MTYCAFFLSCIKKLRPKAKFKICSLDNCVSSRFPKKARLDTFKVCFMVSKWRRWQTSPKASHETGSKWAKTFWSLIWTQGNKHLFMKNYWPFWNHTQLTPISHPITCLFILRTWSKNTWHLAARWGRWVESSNPTPTLLPLKQHLAREKWMWKVSS